MAGQIVVFERNRQQYGGVDQCPDDHGISPATIGGSA